MKTGRSVQGAFMTLRTTPSRHLTLLRLCRQFLIAASVLSPTVAMAQVGWRQYVVPVSPSNPEAIPVALLTCGPRDHIVERGDDRIERTDIVCFSGRRG